MDLCLLEVQDTDIMFLDLSLYLLRPQRTLLHRPIPSILLFSLPLPISPPSHESRRLSEHTSAREPSLACGITPYEPTQRGRIRACTSE